MKRKKILDEPKAKKAKYTLNLADDTKKLIYSYLTQNDVQTIIDTPSIAQNSNHQLIDKENLLKNLKFYGSKKKVVYLDKPYFFSSEKVIAEWLVYDELYILGESKDVFTTISTIYDMIEILVETVRDDQTRELVMSNLPPYLIPLYLATFNPENGNSYKTRKVIARNIEFPQPNSLTVLKYPHPWKFEFHKDKKSEALDTLHPRLFNGYENFSFFVFNESMESFYDNLVQNESKIHKWGNHQIQVFAFIHSFRNFRQVENFVDKTIQVFKFFKTRGIPFSFSSIVFKTNYMDLQSNVYPLLHKLLSVKGIAKDVEIDLGRIHEINTRYEFVQLTKFSYQVTQRPLILHTGANYKTISDYLRILQVPFILLLKAEGWSGDFLTIQSMKGYKEYLPGWSKSPFFVKAITVFDPVKCRDSQKNSTNTKECEELVIQEMKESFSPYFQVTRDAENPFQYNINKTLPFPEFEFGAGVEKINLL